MKSFVGLLKETNKRIREVLQIRTAFIGLVAVDNAAVLILFL